MTTDDEKREALFQEILGIVGYLLDPFACQMHELNWPPQLRALVWHAVAVYASSMEVEAEALDEQQPLM